MDGIYCAVDFEENDARSRLAATAWVPLVTAQQFAVNTFHSELAVAGIYSVSRDEFHKASPYQDGGELFSARRDLFVAAMELHQAFIVESWRKLKPTLAAFTSHLQGQISASHIEGGAMGLWDAFFLTVPLISTSFASFPRLFKGIEADELAWTLIDEAGQATTQQALGAIWRSKRTVIVGEGHESHRRFETAVLAIRREAFVLHDGWQVQWLLRVDGKLKAILQNY